MADSTPTLAGFTAYVRAIPFDSTVIPDGDPGFDIAFAIAMAWTPQTLNSIDPIVYTYTVYEWGTSVMIARQPDQPNQTFFTTLRQGYKTDNFVAGVVQSAADQGTSDALAVADSLKGLGMTQLALLKDPWGRRALAACMSIGPLWGLTP